MATPAERNMLNTTFTMRGGTAPPAWVFGYSSRMVDSWQSLIEPVHTFGYDVPDSQVSVEIYAGSTRDLAYPHWTRKPWRRWRRRLSIAVREQLVFDSRYEGGVNVYHSLVNIASLVISARRLCRDAGISERIVVVLRSSATSMEKRILELLGIEWICTDREVEGLILKMTGSGVPLARAYENSTAFSRMPSKDLPQDVLILRKRTRRLLNAAELQPLLKRHGFVTVYFEDLLMEQQWTINVNARRVMAIHGAALASRMLGGWGDSDRQTIELFGGYMANCYRSLAALQGHRWSAVRGRITPQVWKRVDEEGNARSMVNQDFVVDVRTVRLCLEHMADGGETWRATDEQAVNSSAL